MADTADIDARIAAARERYAEERAKRVKPKGDKQYSHLSGKFADFDTDPYVEPGFTREPIVEEFEQGADVTLLCRCVNSHATAAPDDHRGVTARVALRLSSLAPTFPIDRGASCTPSPRSE